MAALDLLSFLIKYLVFPAIIFTVLTSTHGDLNVMIQYIGHRITAIGNSVACLIADRFLLHLSYYEDFKDLKGTFLVRSLTYMF